MGSGFVDKFQLLEFLDRIAGGSAQPLTQIHLQQHREEMLRLADAMLSAYKRLPDSSPTKRYYKLCWLRFERANDDGALLEAFNFLRSSIRWD